MTKPRGHVALSWGKIDFDEHTTQSAAVEHIRQLAAAEGPATLHIHWALSGARDEA